MPTRLAVADEDREVKCTEEAVRLLGGEGPTASAQHAYAESATPASACSGTDIDVTPYKGKSGGIISRAPNQLTVLDLIIERPAEVSTQQAALDAWNGSVGHEGGGRFWRLFDAGLTIRAGVPAEARPFEVASMPKPPPPVTGTQAPVNGATGRADGPLGKNLLGTAPDGTAVARPYIGGDPCSACLRPSAIGCPCGRGAQLQRGDDDGGLLAEKARG